MGKNVGDKTKAQTKTIKAKELRSEFNSQVLQGFSGFLGDTGELQTTAGPGPSQDELLAMAVPNKKFLLAAPQGIPTSLLLHSVLSYTVQSSSQELTILICILRSVSFSLG